MWINEENLSKSKIQCVGQKYEVTTYGTHEHEKSQKKNYIIMSNPREKVIELYTVFKNAPEARDIAIIKLKAFLCEMNQQAYKIQANKIYWQSVDLEFTNIIREMPYLLP